LYIFLLAGVGIEATFRRAAVFRKYDQVVGLVQVMPLAYCAFRRAADCYCWRSSIVC
jgi:hypothetical protein